MPGPAIPPGCRIGVFALPIVLSITMATALAIALAVVVSCDGGRVVVEIAGGSLASAGFPDVRLGPYPAGDAGALIASVWCDGRAVECAGLENR